MPRKLLKPFEEFFRHEASSGILLMLCALLAIILANTPLSTHYEDLLHHKITVGFGQFSMSYSLLHWINDGLMALFFFVVGMEIKRELTVGELRSPKQALLPVGAAIGGMVVPALLYFVFNQGTETISGWGVPMATDIAFALGALSLLGSKKAPKALAVFLVALAIVDDLGAILVIALFYTAKVSWLSLAAAVGVLAMLVVANRRKVDSTPLYLFLGLLLWLAILKSGIHATIAGVLLGLTIPIHTKGTKASMLHQLEHTLEPWIAYGIMPIFALANSGVSIDFGTIGTLVSTPVSLGIISGLIIGKQLGIFGAAWIMLRLKIAVLPRGINLKHIYGASILGGIGFTMSLFIANLAFTDTQALATAKIAIIIASVLAGAVGLLVLGLRQEQTKKVRSIQ